MTKLTLTIPIDEPSHTDTNSSGLTHRTLIQELRECRKLVEVMRKTFPGETSVYRPELDRLHKTLTSVMTSLQMTLEQSQLLTKDSSSETHAL